MPDFALITQLKDEPVALAVLAGMVLFKIMEPLVKYILPLITKKARKSVNEMFAEINGRLDELNKAVADNEELLDSVSQGTLENMLFNDKQSPFRRLKSFLRLLAMGKNGRVWQKGFEIVLNNKETWLDVLDTKPKMKITDQRYLDEKLNEINRRIFAG